MTWERYTATTNGFINLANDSRATFSPANSKTFATLANLTLGDSGDYECVGAAPQLSSIRQRANDLFILPG